jgi:hypothetical protein
MVSPGYLVALIFCRGVGTVIVVLPLRAPIRKTADYLWNSSQTD